MTTDKNPEPTISFRGEYFYRSNFYMVSVELDGVFYPSVEHAFQAAKTTDFFEREKIRAAITPGQAKILGRKVALRTGWEEMKLDVMLDLLRQKFKVASLRIRLSRSDDHEIIERNTWNDTFWGVCRGKGENHLGKLLMQVREEIR